MSSSQYEIQKSEYLMQYYYYISKYILLTALNYSKEESYSQIPFSNEENGKVVRLTKHEESLPICNRHGFSLLNYIKEMIKLPKYIRNNNKSKSHISQK